MPPIAPSVRALLRDLVPDPEVRETAYALESVIQELVWITGPLVVAAVIAFASPDGRPAAQRRGVHLPAPRCSSARRARGVAESARCTARPRRRCWRSRSCGRMLGADLPQRPGHRSDQRRPAGAGAARRLAAGLGRPAGAVERGQHDRRPVVRGARAGRRRWPLATERCCWPAAICMRAADRGPHRPGGPRRRAAGGADASRRCSPASTRWWAAPSRPGSRPRRSPGSRRRWSAVSPPGRRWAAPRSRRRASAPRSRSACAAMGLAAVSAVRMRAGAERQPA